MESVLRVTLTSVREEPQKLKKPLYEIQKAVLYAMADAESDCARRHAVAVLPMSFGKTVVTLALAAEHPCPPETPPPLLYDSQLEVHFTVTPAARLDATVVYVGTTVYDHWQQTAADFTQLPVYAVKDLRTLGAFAKLVADWRRDPAASRLAGPFVLLVRVGRLSRPLEGGPADPSISEQVRALLWGARVARVVLDDYDTLAWCGGDRLPAAGFTWGLTATPQVLRGQARKSEGPFSLAERVVDASVRLFLLQVKADICRELRTSLVLEGRVVVRGGAVGHLLRGLGGLGDLVEAANSRAVHQVCSAAGIAATDSMAAALTAYLNAALSAAALKKVTVMYLEKALATLTFAAGAEPDPSAFLILAAAERRHEEFDRRLEEDRRTPQSSDARARIVTEIAALEKQIAEAHEAHKRRIAGAAQVMRSTQCDVCQLDLADHVVFHVLAACCQIVVCDGCHRDGVCRTTCPNCRSPVVDVFKIDFKLAADTAAHMQAMASAAPDIGVEGLRLLQTEVLVLPPKLDVKMQAVVDWVAGDVRPDYKEVVYPDTLPPAALGPAEGAKKCLLYTSSQEASRQIQRQLADAGYPVWMLGGTCVQASRALAAARDCQAPVSFLLVATREQCAGANMPFITHVAFYHRVTESRVRTQVIGRAARLGRAADLLVCDFLFDRE